MSAAEQAIRLGRVLDTEQARLRDLESIRDGTVGASALLIQERLREVRLAPLMALDTPWVAFALGAVAERMRITGVSVEGVERPDLLATWRAGVPLSVESATWLAILTHGRGYVLSWVDETGQPFVSMESAAEVYAELHPRTGSPTTAIKRWVSPEGEARAIVFEGTQVTHLRSNQSVPTETWGPPQAHTMPMAVSAWQTVRVDPNPLGRVPISPIVLPHHVADPIGRSDVEPLRGVAAAITKTVLDLLVVAEHFSAPRRFATGVALEVDPETGETINPFGDASGPSPRVLVSEAVDSKFGQFPASDMRGLLDLHERLVEDLLSRAAVPRHLSLGGARGQAVDATSVQAHEAGLLARVAQRCAAVGDGVGRALRLTEEISTGRPAGRVEVSWAPAGTQSLAADADSIAKLTGLGLDPVGVARYVLGLSAEDAEALRANTPSEPDLAIASTSTEGPRP